MTSTEALRKMAQSVLDKGGYATTSEDACAIARAYLALTAPLDEKYAEIAAARTWLELPMYAGAGLGKYMAELEQAEKHLANVLDAIRVVTGERDIAADQALREFARAEMLQDELTRLKTPPITIFTGEP